MCYIGFSTMFVDTFVSGNSPVICSRYTHTYIHTYIHTYTHTYIHTYIHAYIHTYIHTCIYIYTYIYAMKSRTNRRQIAQTNKNVIQEYIAKYMFALWSNYLFMISSQLFLILYWYSYYGYCFLVNFYFALYR